MEKMLLESPAVKSAISRVSSASARYEEALREKAELEERVALTEQQKEEIEQLTVGCTSIKHILYFAFQGHHVLAKAEVEAAKKRMQAAELEMLSVSDEQRTLKEMVKTVSSDVLCFSC